MPSHRFQTYLFRMSFARFFVLLVACTSISTVFAQNKFKSPNEFLPHELGEQFTPHYMLNNYFEYLAANAPTTMRLEKYGLTNEARPLQVAFFSAPENLNRLEQIRINNLRLAGMASGAPDLTNPIAIVWLSMSVHGNEASGSECSMELAYRLAAQDDPKIREWLKNTLVIVDPSSNPDGYDRYSSWNRMANNLLKNTHADSREHREPWPGGRPNHYYFDLNRDWAWATQVETQQRIAEYQRWLPQIHADLHEQGVDNNYYFAPAAEPLHDYITPWQREYQTLIGKNHARYFDQHGWLYFTREEFDLFYPSYGDTYPMFNGAIGMTYEQAGNSRAGRAILTSTGDTLTLHDRILHHLTTSLSTIEIASQNAAKSVENFQAYFSRSASQPQGQYKAYIIRENNDPNKVNTLCQLLDRHKISYGRVGAGLSGVKAFDYIKGRETTVSINPNDLVISAFQPKSVLLQVLFDPESRLTDSLTYDITAWALPYAHGLDAYALHDRLEPKRPYVFVPNVEVKLAASPYAWCVHRRSVAEAEFLSEVLQKGIKVRYSTHAFAMADQQFEAGTYIVNRADNRTIADKLDGLVKAAAARTNVALHPIFTGFSAQGNDFGSSDAFLPVKRPEVAMFYGEDVDENAFGHIWFFFERELGYPISAIQAERLERMNLDAYTTLIVANGTYNFTEKQTEIIKAWVQRGGRLILLENALNAFADKAGFEIKAKDLPKPAEGGAPKPYEFSKRDGMSDQSPGAVVRAKVDGTHPLSYGLSEYYFSLKTAADAYEIPTKGATAIYLEESFQSYGFIGSRLRKRLGESPMVGEQKSGKGDIVYFVDSPLFRDFWQQGKLLFTNALFY